MLEQDFVLFSQLALFCNVPLDRHLDGTLAPLSEEAFQGCLKQFAS
jgi:hypothetical protein